MGADLLPLGGQSSIGLAVTNRSTERQLLRQLDQVQARALLAQIEVRAQGEIAEAVLDNVGRLSEVERDLTRSAPNGQARYAMIVDAYTASAASALIRNHR